MIKAGGTLDAAAVALSAGCLVHCVILPIGASMLPLLGVASEVEWIHWAFVALAAPASAAALWRNDGSTTLAWVLRAFALAGVSLLVLAAAGWPDHDWETPLTVVGAMVLATTHVVNFLRRHPSA